MADYLTTPDGRRIAYHRTDGAGPGVVFLGGFKSDMEGTKAVHLEAWAKAKGRAFLRFDYSGHGESSEAFEDGSIGDWAADARAAIGLIDGPLVLVGSSMGGWISLLLARAMPERIKALVLIAAAPDFTESMAAEFSDAQHVQLMEDGRTLRPSDYGDPYVITRRLIEDGRQNLVLRTPLALPFPVRMLWGTADDAVTMDVQLRLME
ncbi:MAG: alpha/beta fold hydrolase, partial [Pseudomonadota bacterium]